LLVLVVQSQKRCQLSNGFVSVAVVIYKKGLKNTRDNLPCCCIRTKSCDDTKHGKLTISSFSLFHEKVLFVFVHKSWWCFVCKDVLFTVFGYSCHFKVASGTGDDELSGRQIYLSYCFACCRCTISGISC